MVWQKHCYPDLGRGGAEQRERPPMQGAAPRWYGRNIVSLDLGRGGAEQRECPPMWGEGIMPIDFLPVGLDCSHEGAVPKCKNIATPISVGAVL